MVGKVQRLVLGRPLRSVEAQDERLSQSRALGAFGLDALSSVAYGPNEILYVLILAGAAGTRFSLPGAPAITALLAIVITPYPQTPFAYPNRRRLVHGGAGEPGHAGGPAGRRRADG